MTSSLYILTSTFLILLTTAFLRLLHTLPTTHRTRPAPRPPGTPTHLLIVLGSGGHTAEMLSLLSHPDFSTRKYSWRSYVVGSGDAFSAGRAHEFERGISKGNDSISAEKGMEKVEGMGKENGFSIHTVPRARRIHQRLLSTPLTSLHCLYACLTLLLHHPYGFPDLILTNGPATSLIVILAATILRYFAFLAFMSCHSDAKARRGKMRTIYIESWARVKRPSLSGRIIVWCGLCDRVLVQWKGLEERGWGEFRGVLVR